MRLTLIIAGLVAMLGALAQPASADEAELRAVIAKFADATKFSQTEEVIEELAALGDPAAAPALNELSEGNLQVRERDGEVFIIRCSGATVRLLDPLTFAAVAPTSACLTR